MIQYRLYINLYVVISFVCRHFICMSSFHLQLEDYVQSMRKSKPFANSFQDVTQVSESLQMKRMY